MAVSVRVKAEPTGRLEFLVAVTFAVKVKDSFVGLSSPPQPSTVVPEALVDPGQSYVTLGPVKLKDSPCAPSITPLPVQ
jgi:hypothetical protein